MYSKLFQPLAAGALALLVVLAACAPKAPPPVPATIAPTVQAPAPAPAPKLSAEDAAWDKVVTEAKKEGKVVFYTVNLIGAIGQAIDRAFYDRYGIKVEWVAGIGAVLLERVRSEYAAGKNIADLYDTATAWALIAKQEGLLQQVGYLPVLAERDVWRVPPIFDPEGYLPAFGVSYLGPLINTNLVKQEEEPKSYRDFLSSQWKGRLVMGSPSTDPRPAWLYVIGKKHGFIDDEYFRQLAKQNLKIVPSLREVDATLARGEASAAVTAIGSTAAAMIREGAPMRMLAMAEGTQILASPPIAIWAKAPHPNASRLFVNWILSAEGQAVYAKARASTPIRKDVPDFLPAGAQIAPKKALPWDIVLEAETTKIQREKYMEKLLGIEIK